MTPHHTRYHNRMALTTGAALLDPVDALVRELCRPDRDRAIEAAVEEQLARFRRARLAEACARLDPAEERALAEEI